MVEACKTNEQIAPDQEWLRSQAETTQSYFDERVDDMMNGRHVPVGAATVGFGFWALSLHDRVANETTSAMVEYLLQIQGFARIDSTSNTTAIRDGRWVASCRRAPMQASAIGDTALVMIGMKRFASEEQADRVTCLSMKRKSTCLKQS